MSINPIPPSSSAMERTRLQAFKELRSLLSEVLASAVADEEVPDAFKEKSNWDKLIAQTEQRLAEGWKQRFDTGMERRAKPRQLLDLLPPEEEQQQLLSEHFINEVSYQGRQSLDELDRQLAAMAGTEYDDTGPNPLGPLAWVEGLRGGIRQIRCTPEERDWLLARLVPLLISRITGFYSTLTTQITHAGYPGRPARGGGGGRAAPAGAGAGAGGNNQYSPDLVPSLNDGQSVFGAGGSAGAIGEAGGVPTEGGEVLDRLFGLLSARRGGPEFAGPGAVPGVWPQGTPPGYAAGALGFPAGAAGYPGAGPAFPGGEGGGGYAPGPGYGGLPGYGPPPGPGGYPVYPLGGAPMVPGVPGAYPAFGPTVPNNYPGMPGGVPLGPPGAFPAAPAGAGEDAGAVAAMPVAPVPLVPWSQADIFSVLSLLQGSYSASPARGVGSVVGHLHEAIGSTATQLGLAGGIQAMPGPAQDMLELVSMLFEALLDGRRLDEKARSQLARLVIPYVRVAMLDRRLFMQSSHPARRVLNLLVEAFETAAPEVTHFRSLRELAFTVVERIIEEFDDNLRLFEKLEDILATELEAGRRRAELAERRAADAQSGKERRQVARETVSRILSEAILGKSLPPVLLDFLAGPWQHHHTVVMLREGEQGEGVMLSRGLLDQLLLANEAGALDDAPSLRPVVVEVLASSGQPGSAADELLIELSLALAVRSHVPEDDFAPRADSLDSADSGEIVPVVVERVLVESPEVIIQHTPVQAEPEANEDAYVVVSDTVATELPADVIERYQNYPIGTWLDFVAEDGRVTSARISWTSPISGRRILSNRRGQRMLVASPEELAEMEVEGRIRPRHSESAFDQALHTIADRLQGGVAVPAILP